MIKIKNAGKVYKTFTLKETNLQLKKGEILGLVGENGAGKTTLIKLITGLINPSFGSVEIFDDQHKPQHNEHLGVVFDTCPYIQMLKADQINNIFKNVYKTWNEKTFFDALEKLKVDKSKQIKDYSHGMTMKIQIAVAFAHDTKILILDEATNGLDPLSKDIFFDMVLDFMQDGQKTVLISSHIISDIEKICDRVAFMHKGEFAFCDFKDDILEKYAIIKCTKEQFEKMHSDDIIGFRATEFVTEVLVVKDKIKGDFVFEKPNLEDIVLFMLRGDI